MPVSVSPSRLRAARERASISREFAAIKTKRSYWTISAYERGVATPPARVLVALSQLYGCSVKDLLGDESKVS
jgi:transcriptional regulator with XRE-family HTH domain